MAKILIVEDDPSLNMTYDIILRKEGHDVMQAADGAEALRMAAAFDPDLILLDYRMPNMNGLDFLRCYNVKMSHPNVKVIMFSNMDLPEAHDEVYKLGVAAILLKSATSPKQLAVIINKTLHQ